jgi:hypothetical protein
MNFCLNPDPKDDRQPLFLVSTRLWANVRGLSQHLEALEVAPSA